MNVLVVEDEPRMLDILERHIARMGYEVRGASNAGEALEQLEGRTADVVLTDIRMPGLDGRALLEIVRERHPDTRVILMTAFGRVEDAVEAMRAGAYWYICKPFKMDEVAGILRNAAREVLLVKQVEGLRHAVHGRWSADRLMGRSKAMQEVRALIRQAAGLSATVLVTGRSGTGKELAARAIHYEGPRAIRPFVAVNCAAIPEALFESAMFGHRRGAFTGAVSNQVGFFEQADGSTLFLDEVGEIPFTQQPKILRVLQDGEVTAVGATRTTKVDLRIICATNRDLEQLVAQGTFRPSPSTFCSTSPVTTAVRPQDSPPKPSRPSPSDRGPATSVSFATSSSAR
jgi:DNA-binding NtrC family response regulator